MAAQATGTLTIDAADGAVTEDLASAQRWHALVLHRGRPVARVDLASPGRTEGDALHAAALLRWADWEATREALVERLRARMGMDPSPAPPPVAISVVVCTHRRPADLRRLLDGLRRLDPAPLEILVVDNDPGEHDCEADARAAGARYVREDRRGLDNARNAGVAAARGDVVAFIDDDCVAPPGWLRRLPEEFANPVVAGVTGPAFPHTLDTPSRRRMEAQASLARGLHRLTFDWLNFPVAGAGVIGVGANMAFRRDVLRSLGSQPFAPELDAGTATQSGGDTYAMAKVLLRGHRLVYDPSTFIYHRHREDPAALHRALFGYGVGLSAALTKLTVEDRELSAPRTWLWLLSQYRKTQQRRFAGIADAVETRLAWDYIRGGVRGAWRWRRALREAPVQAEPPVGHTPAECPPVAAAAVPQEAAQLAVTVVVPTSGRPESLDRCLDALARQDAAPGSYEVVVVDDSPRGDAVLDPRHAARLQLRVLRGGGRGAAAARNAGARSAEAPLVLFVDDDVIAEPGLVGAHLERHAREGTDAAVVGPYFPRPAGDTFAAAAAAIWWDDLFHALGHAQAHTYLAALTGNLSISTAAFARSGGFDERFGRTRREDWEWGYRALGAGVSLHYEPAARARHEYRLDARGRLRAAELEGSGDALMLQHHPGAASAMLPLVAGALDAGGRTRALQRVAWEAPQVRAVALSALALIERLRMRATWTRAFNAAQRLSYLRGVRAAAPHPPRAAEPLLDVDLDGSDPIPPPAHVPPTIRVRVAGREVARVEPALGQWTPALAEQIADAVPWRALDRAADRCGCRPARDERHAHAARTLIVLSAAPGAQQAAVAELAAAGAAVTVADGPPQAHWDAVMAQAASTDRELVATVMPGIRPDPRWLQEALAAFDGERVGVVVGRGLADVAPPAPLILHARAATTDLRHEAVVAPSFVVLRRSLLAGLQEAGDNDPLASLHTLVEHALDGGWVVGYRDVHGLAGHQPGWYEGARALAAVRVRRSRRPAQEASAELRRATFMVARALARGERRQAALRSFAGTLSGVQRAWLRRGASAS